MIGGGQLHGHCAVTVGTASVGYRAAGVVAAPGVVTAPVISSVSGHTAQRPG